MPRPIGYDPEDPDLPGMSLKDFSEASGMSYSAISREIPCSVAYPRMIATGEAWPSFYIARRIEKATNGAVPRTRWYPAED